MKLTKWQARDDANEWGRSRGIHVTNKGLQPHTVPLNQQMS
jgi:hypothetical protein|eukprot:COSAG01_NODE_2001_length_8673_cov_22.568346_3_plen_41_part_00